MNETRSDFEELISARQAKVTLWKALPKECVYVELQLIHEGHLAELKLTYAQAFLAEIKKMASVRQFIFVDIDSLLRGLPRWSSDPEIFPNNA